MQIPKLLPAICVAVICASFISVRADDSAMQAALRAALDQKMGELDKQQTQAPPVVVTPPGAVKAKSSKSPTNTVPAKAIILRPAPSPAETKPVPMIISGRTGCRSDNHFGNQRRSGGFRNDGRTGCCA